MRALSLLLLLAACGEPEPNHQVQTGPLDDGHVWPDAAADAQAFVRRLTLGVNIERGWAWAVPGEPTFWSYLHDTLHVTHVRLFYPWRPTVDMGGGGPGNSPPDEALFGRILDAAEHANAAGLVVFLDCTDVMGVEDFTDAAGAETEAHIANCATWAAARHFDPTMFALGPVNEWAGGDDNATYNQTRQHYQDVLRAQLPGYVLTTGPAYWKSRDWLYDASHHFQTFSDLRVVYEWHEYSSLDAQGWTDEEAKLAAWRAANGDRPTICGECGPGYWDEPVDGTRLASDPAAWPARYDALLPVLAHEHPSPWAITYGGDYRLNLAADDPHLSADFVTMFVDNEAAIRSALGL